MPSLTLAIPADLKTQMGRFPEINWSEVARQAIAAKMQALQALQHLLKRSALTEEEAVALGRHIKQRVWRKHHRAA